MDRIEHPSGAHSAWRDDRMPGMLQQANEDIPIKIIIEVEPHTGSTKNCRACNQACSCALAWQITRTSLVAGTRSEEHTSELQSLTNLVCRLLLEKKKK